jgi:hypothetical protein
VIGITSSVQVEPRALKDGLLMALELEIYLFEIEMNSLVAIELRNSTKLANVFLRFIMDDCRCLLERFNQFKPQHIYQKS